MRIRRAVVLSLLSGLVLGADVEAQNIAGAAERSVRPHFGFALGLGAVPRAFEPNCVDGWDGHTTSASVEVRGGLRWGRLGVEARTAPWTEIGLSGAADCITRDPVFSDGTHTVRSSPIDRGPFVMTDIRGYYVLRLQPVEWQVSAGGGWVWSRGVPTLVFGTGIRFGSDLRGVIDAEFSSYRIPWDETTEVWFDAERVRTIDSTSEKLWQRAFSIRVGLEVAVQS